MHRRWMAGLEFEHAAHHIGPEGLIDSWCKRDGGGAADAALVGWRLATISGSNGR